MNENETLFSFNVNKKKTKIVALTASDAMYQAVNHFDLVEDSGEWLMVSPGNWAVPTDGPEYTWVTGDNILKTTKSPWEASWRH